jgi:hypothetical protein
MVDVNEICKMLNVKHTNILNQTNISINNSVTSMIELIHMSFIVKTECKV